MKIYRALDDMQAVKEKIITLNVIMPEQLNSLRIKEELWNCNGNGCVDGKNAKCDINRKEQKKDIHKKTQIISKIEQNSRIEKILCKLYKCLEEMELQPFEAVLKYNLLRNHQELKFAMETLKLRDSINLFIIDAGEYGVNLEYQKMLFLLRDYAKSENYKATITERGADRRCGDDLNEGNFFADSIGGIIVDGQSELFTKKIGREMVFAANMAGCSFVGRGLVEAIGDLGNYDLKSRLSGISRDEAYENGAIELVNRLVDYKCEQIVRREKRKYGELNISCGKNGIKRKILAIHSSHFKKSNTLGLWEIVRKNIANRNIEVTQISLAKNNVDDCRGCTHDTCLHFGEQSSCYYGGYIVDEVFPRVLESDAIVMISPNYNDSLSGNLVAFINRLTSLYKVNAIEEKAIFGIIVSGYSGSDIVAEQIIGAMSMNKGFFLPSKFVIYERANRANEILECENIEEKGRRFAENIWLSLEKKL